MKIQVATTAYSITAILAAIKKQQVFADWRLEAHDGNSATLSCDRIAQTATLEECEWKLRRQLDDEQLREKLECDFGRVRDMLVDAALSPIIGTKR